MEIHNHSNTNYADLQTQYQSIDTDDPESVNNFNEAMYKFQQGISFDANFQAGWHSIMKDLINLLSRV
jgi:hypothetical protein